MSLSPKMRAKIQFVLSCSRLGYGWSAILLGLQCALLSIVLHGSNFGNCNYNSWNWDAAGADAIVMFLPLETLWGGIVGLIGGLVIALCATFVLWVIGKSSLPPRNIFIAILSVTFFGWTGMMCGGAAGWMMDIYHPIAPTWWAPFSYQQTRSGLIFGLILGNFLGVACGGTFSGATERFLKFIMRGFSHK